MEARIATIESILKTAQIIDESETSNDKVHLTSVVTIEMVGTDRQMTYKIVGSGSNETNRTGQNFRRITCGQGSHG